MAAGQHAAQELWAERGRRRGGGWLWHSDRGCGQDKSSDARGAKSPHVMLPPVRGPRTGGHRLDRSKDSAQASPPCCQGFSQHLGRAQAQWPVSAPRILCSHSQLWSATPTSVDMWADQRSPKWPGRLHQVRGCSWRGQHRLALHGPWGPRSGWAGTWLPSLH